MDPARVQIDGGFRKHVQSGSRWREAESWAVTGGGSGESARCQVPEVRED